MNLPSQEPLAHREAFLRMVMRDKVLITPPNAPSFPDTHASSPSSTSLYIPRMALGSLPSPAHFPAAASRTCLSNPTSLYKHQADFIPPQRAVKSGKSRAAGAPRCTDCARVFTENLCARICSKAKFPLSQSPEIPFKPCANKPEKKAFSR